MANKIGGQESGDENLAVAVNEPNAFDLSNLNLTSMCASNTHKISHEHKLQDLFIGLVLIPNTKQAGISCDGSGIPMMACFFFCSHVN